METPVADAALAGGAPPATVEMIYCWAGAADAAVVKLEGLSRGLALTTDCTPRYCQADPKTGTLADAEQLLRALLPRAFRRPERDSSP